MAKKTNIPNKTVKPQAQAPVGGKPARPVADNKSSVATKKDYTRWYLVAILLLTVIAYWASLGNQFTNWDDPGYVTNNPVIKDLSAEGIKRIFAWSNPIMGNYHPLTIFTYAIDYHFNNLNPYSYHLQSLLFHLLTCVFVYYFTLKLTDKKIWVAVIATALFAIHPMHVESVSWAAGRKDVVYGAFYMLSCYAYLMYLERKDNKAQLIKWYAIVLLSFLASILSKPVAVSLPITLLAIDYFRSRKDTIVNIILEKVPLLVISVIFGIKSMQDQVAFKALGTQDEKFNFLERIQLGAYALTTYLWKAIVPVKLLCFYPYPLKVDGSLPAIYWMYPLIITVLVAAVFYLFRKNKAVVFGCLFFLINIALLLQFIPVGGAIIADRYSYIPYLGLFIAIGWLVDASATVPQLTALARPLLYGVLAYVVVLSVMTNKRSLVWYDSLSLWRDEVEVEPMRAPSGYNNLGYQYFLKFNESVDQNQRKVYYDSAYFLLTRAIELQAKFVNPYVSVGELLRSNHQFPEAKGYYYKALKLDTSDQAANAYLGLAITYSIEFLESNRSNAMFWDSAIFCYNQTFKLKPYYPEAHSNYANLLDIGGRANDAIVEYTKAVEQNPDIVAPYLNRGRAYMRMNKINEAMQDLNKAIAIDPEKGELYYARASCYAQSGNKAAARADIEKAKSYGFTNMSQDVLNSIYN